MDDRKQNEMNESSENDISEKKPDYKPWELDLRGQPLSQRKREITSYELWLQSKTEKDGLAYQCPSCGEENRILPGVTGQKCDKCGFKFEEYKSIVEEMELPEETKEPPAVSRLPTGFGDVGKVTGKDLAIPDFLNYEPIETFSLVFRNSSFLIWLIFTAIFVATLFFILPIFRAGYGVFFNLVLLAFLIFSGISIFTGLSRSSSITSIRVNNDGVIFSGFSGSTHMQYDEITSISNNREVNGMIRLRGAIESNALSFIIVFSIMFLLITYPVWLGLMFSLPIFSWIRFMFYACVAVFFYFIHRAYHDTLGSAVADSSASSAFYNNHIGISTKQRSINYSFVGAGNVQFVRALAIIIFMAKKKNKQCRIDRAALQAAEKGQEHYIGWARRHNRY